MKPWRHTSQGFCGHPEAVAFVKASYTQREIDRFYNFFCPDGCRPQFQFDDLYVLLAYLKDHSLQCISEEPYEPQRNVSSIRVKKKSHVESPHHIYLKKLATAWLQDKKFVKKVSYEEGFRCGVADVVSEDGLWIVECGATRPNKVFDQIFGHGEKDKDSKVVLFNDLTVSTFSAGPNFEKAKEEDIKKDRQIRKKMAKKMGWIL